VEDPSGGLRRNPRPLPLDVIFKFRCYHSALWYLVL